MFWSVSERVGGGQMEVWGEGVEWGWVWAGVGEKPVSSSLIRNSEVSHLIFDHKQDNRLMTMTVRENLE